jgi:uncharacterized protein YdeI (YjbR/CyaY-like superfamily)
MCHICDDLQRKIDQHRRALGQSFDALTKERIFAGIKEMQKMKDEMHK